MLDYIYHMTIKLLLNNFFCVNPLRTSLHSVTKICKPIVSSISMHVVISLPEVTSYDNSIYVETHG